ncbi:MAG: class IV adenylate cyclase [Pseudomonadota bacterium]
MANNIEIKARAVNPARQRQLAADVSGSEPETLQQRDTFFNSPNGRLKLREFAQGAAQLIFYHRADQAGPKLSDYHITETDDAAGLKAILESAYGIRAVVSKVRELHLCGRTRIHLDSVEGLGEFIELEVVLEPGEDIHAGEKEAQSLMQRLEIEPDHLVEQAYVDLLEAVREDPQMVG